MVSLKYIFLLLLFSVNISAQVLEGRIIDTLGIPVNAVSIYIPEIKQGLVSNQDGRFRIILEEGNFTLFCKYPGYKKAEYRISMLRGDSLKREFKIERDTFYSYNPSQEAEKLAYQIINNSRKMAPVYNNAVQYYKASSYLKGKWELKYVHALLDKVSSSYKIEKFRLSELKNKIAVQEMNNEIEYYYPDKYNINVKGSLGNIPDGFTTKGGLDIQRGSIYSNRFGRFISPLSRSAHTFYRFHYRGYYAWQETKYHKIEIEPKKNDPELLSGYLYIEEGSWAIYYATLKSNVQGMDITTDIAYNQLLDNIFLPITYYNDIAFSFPGIKGTISYYTTIKYDEVSGKKIERNQSGVSEDETMKNSIMIGSEAFVRDSSYWANIRRLPFENDSIEHIPDSLHFSKDKLNPTNHWIGKILLGDYIIGNESENFSLKYSGVKMIFRDYNYVDGFWLGNRFELKAKINEKKSIEAYPYIYYVTGRNRILGGSDMTYNYNPRRAGKLSFSFGSRSDDFNNLSLTRYQNYFASLFFGENYNFFYQRDFASITNSIHLNRKIKVSTSFGIEKRSGLSNHTNFNLFNRNHIKPNMFSEDRFDRTYYSVGLSYSPRSDYSITEALDMYAKKITPVFNIDYQEGFSSWQANNSKYQKLKGGMSHNIQLDYFNYIDYKIESGVFLKRDRNMHFTDYQHFGASDLLLNLNSLFDSFMLLDNYELQTNRYWVNLFLNYSGKYVLLKHISFLQGKPFTENLHLKTLFTPDVKSYVETGYSISFNRYFGVGVFTSFHNTKARKFGVRLSLNLRSLKFD